MYINDISLIKFGNCVKRQFVQKWIIKTVNVEVHTFRKAAIKHGSPCLLFPTFITSIDLVSEKVKYGTYILSYILK